MCGVVVVVAAAAAAVAVYVVGCGVAAVVVAPGEKKGKYQGDVKTGECSLGKLKLITHTHTHADRRR